MKNYRKTYYAYNAACKDEIVYPTATGEFIRLTSKDFDSEDEFLKWKIYSDRLYHEEQKSDDMYSKKHTSIDFIDETSLDSVEAYDERMVREEETKLLAEEIRKLLKNSMSEKQLNRLILDAIYKISQDKIAEIEGCTQSAVAHSIADGKARVKKYFEKFSKTPHKMPAQIPLSERVSFLERQHQKEVEKRNKK